MNRHGLALLLLLFAPMSWGATCKITEYRVLGLTQTNEPPEKSARFRQTLENIAETLEAVECALEHVDVAGVLRILAQLRSAAINHCCYLADVHEEYRKLTVRRKGESDA